ncbi:hypothetical protein NDU88_001991 [Pleurodeles waltl]|uniref:Uncharacterized protein n=1 Tax=Pleurodeles waltl TaxID=8319 RepID=A0AAV7TLR6_PLEWA|nr:hypothetical protein NDU88_001991 [Pleurodeles waltl]
MAHRPRWTAVKARSHRAEPSALGLPGMMRILSNGIWRVARECRVKPASPDPSVSFVRCSNIALHSSLSGMSK